MIGPGGSSGKGRGSCSGDMDLQFPVLGILVIPLPDELLGPDCAGDRQSAPGRMRRQPYLLPGNGSIREGPRPELIPQLVDDDSILNPGGFVVCLTCGDYHRFSSISSAWSSDSEGTQSGGCRSGGRGSPWAEGPEGAVGDMASTGFVDTIRTFYALLFDGVSPGGSVIQPQGPTWALEDPFADGVGF